MNSGEAFDKAVADISGKKFGNIKIGFDVCCVVISLALSLIIFDGKIKIQGKSVDVANDPVAKEFYLGKDFAL